MNYCSFINNGDDICTCEYCGFVDRRANCEKTIRRCPVGADGDKTKEFGDMVADALSAVGITKERVSGWLGRPCGCAERQEKLNALHSWARRTLKEITSGEDNKQQFEKMVEEEKGHIVPDDLPTMVAVVGPNRSGTSCVAGVIHKLGVSMGNSFIPTTWHNPKGYYEETELQEYMARKPKSKYTNKQIIAWFSKWAERRCEAPIVGCKHPTLCNMLPQMEKVWPNLKIIATSRPVDDICESLKRAKWAGKDGRRGKIEGLIQHRDKAIKRLNLPVLPVDYTRIVNSPAVVVDEIIHFLGITPTMEHRQSAIDHVDHSLCHIKPPVNNPIDVVYPLSNGTKWSNNEIRYSLRSLDKYASNLGRVFIVTEKLPPWMKGVVHVPCSDIRGRNKDANIIDKIRAAIKAGVSERFIFASDDQYLIAPTDLASLPVSYANWKGGKSKWWKRFNRTQKHLLSIGKPTQFYESHLFQPHSASQFEKAVASCDYNTNPGFTVNTLTFNQYDPIPYGVPRKVLSGSVMHNYGAKVPQVHKSRMANMFLDRSKYEVVPARVPIARPRVFTYWAGPMSEIIKLCLESMQRNIPDIEVWTLERWKDEYDGLLGPWKSIANRRPNVQSDILRYWLLSTYGGIWLDADYIAFRDIRDVWDQNSDYIGYMDNPKRGMPYTALMGGVPGSPIMDKQCEFARDILKTKLINKKAGPRLTRRAMNACPTAVKKIVPRPLIHPIRWKVHLSSTMADNTPYSFHPDAYGVMLLSRVCNHHAGMTRDQILHHPAVVGQAFRVALGITPAVKEA